MVLHTLYFKTPKSLGKKCVKKFCNLLDDRDYNDVEIPLVMLALVAMAVGHFLYLRFIANVLPDIHRSTFAFRSGQETIIPSLNSHTKGAMMYTMPICIYLMISATKTQRHITSLCTIYGLVQSELNFFIVLRILIQFLF